MVAVGTPEASPEGVAGVVGRAGPQGSRLRKRG